MRILSEKNAYLRPVIICFAVSALIFAVVLYISNQLATTQSYQKMFDRYQSVIKKKSPIITKWNAYNNVDIPIKLRIPPGFSINVNKRKDDGMPSKVEFTAPVKDSAIKSVIIEPGIDSIYESYISPHCILVETTKIDTVLAEISACITKKLEDPSFIAKLSDTNHIVFVAMYTKSDFTEKDIFEYKYLLNSIRL